MENQYIHNITFGETDCTFTVASQPAGDPAAQPLPAVIHTRESLKANLQVCSLSKAQEVTEKGVLLHPDVHSAVSDWLIDT